MKKLSGWRVGVCLVVGFLAACSASPQEGEDGALGGARQALTAAESLKMDLWVPDASVVGKPMDVNATIWWADPAAEPGPGVSDVTLTATVLGSFDVSSLVSFNGVLSCSQQAIPGGVTVTCHADEWPAFAKDGFDLQIVPTLADSVIDSTATLSVGGVELKSWSRQTAIYADTGVAVADLGAFGWGSGTAQLGQPTYTSFFASNYGPSDATNVEMSLVLTGPGAFSSVGVPWWPGATCTWTDTTASCKLGDVGAWWGVPLDVIFVGREPGQVAISATVSGDQLDPVASNDTATSYFEVVRPKVADLAISISDAPDPVRVNGELTYTVVVTNNGPDTASSAVVHDWLQSNVTLVSATSNHGGCYAGWWGSVDCQLGSLASGETATIEIVVTPTEGGTITNEVWVENWNGWEEIDPDFSNNSAVAETTVKGPNPPVITTASQSKFPATFGAYVPCADDFVLLEGTLHGSFHTLYNQKSGLYQYESLFNPQGITGKGLGSGETYHATGMTREAMKWVGGYPGSYTYQNNFRIIGENSANDLLVHATTHITFGPDGSVKASVSSYSFECK